MALSVSMLIVTLKIYTFERLRYGIEECILHDPDCSFADFIPRLMLKIDYKQTEYQCQKISDSLLRDLCYQDRIYDDYFSKAKSSLNSNVCFPIENQHLSFVCLRSMYRRHLQFFMLSPYVVENDFDNGQETCSRYDAYPKLYCNYLKAASLAKNNLSKSINICNSLEDNERAGECKFYIATSLTLNNVKNDNIKNLSNFCESIDNPFWRLECYYLLADEIAKRKKQDILSIKLIAEECSKSRLDGEFYCFDHVMMFLSISQSKQLCSTLNGTNAKECYNGLGRMLMVENNLNLNKTMDQCKKIPSYGLECMKHATFLFGRKAKLKVEEKEQICNELSNPMRGHCINGIGFSIVDDCDEDVQDCNSKCSSSTMDVNYRCYERMGSTIGHLSGKDIFTAFNKCDATAKNYTKYCYSGISHQISYTVTNNINWSIATCKKFPKEFKDECFENLGVTMGTHYAYNLSYAIDKCKQFPSNVKKLCFKGIANYSAKKKF